MRPPFLTRESIFEALEVCTIFVPMLQLTFFCFCKQQDTWGKLF